MKVLVIGSGAREHALAWKILQSPLASRVYCAPGNGGTAQIAQNVPIAPDDAENIGRFVDEEDVGLTILGPEASVAAGVADALIARGRLVFGPTAAAGRIESSKAFAKSLMRRAGVPTPDFQVFDDPSWAQSYVRLRGTAFVVKADGLSQGKGTVVPDDESETHHAIEMLMHDRRLGNAVSRIVVEERIQGEEVSLLVLTDGVNVIPLPAACDYKRALDEDRGPNTGGMGGYTPPRFFRQSQVEDAIENVIRPILAGLRQQGTPYRGCLYAGLMVTDKGLQVLEFNARFGDPEAQVILPALPYDILPLLLDVARGDLGNAARLTSTWARPGSAVGIVLASQGYPGAYETGRPIKGISDIPEGTYAFHAGTLKVGDTYRTSGGRVMTLVGVADDLGQARDLAYAAAGRIHFDGMWYRHDLALRELRTAAYR